MAGTEEDELTAQLEGLLAERRQPAQASGLIEGALIDAVEPVAPPARALSGLLDRVHTGDRITHFVPHLASLYDLSVPDAERLLVQARDASAWMEGPGPGVKLLPVTTGPKVAHALAALVWLGPDAEFPSHEHPGRERVLVLEGSYRDSNGLEFWRGELQVSETGSGHALRALGGIACICAALNATSPEDP